MDFSEKYVKMCKEAKEIQEYKKKTKWQKGDLRYWNKMFFSKVEKIYIITEFTYNEFEEGMIWLPRQDQLQEFLDKNDKYINMHDGLHIMRFLEEFINFIDITMTKYESIEQFLLAFIMWRFYYKTWNKKKEKWEKIYESD